MKVITNNELKCTIVLAALQGVTDPEIGLNVLDLGLINQIDFDEPGRKIILNMTLTTAYCPMGASITGNVEKALQSVFSQEQIEVLLSFDPPWNADRISEEGRRFLQL